VLLIAGWLGMASAARAQTEPLAPGREARLFVRGAADVLEGTLTSLSPEALEIVLLDGSTFTVPAGQIERAEVLANRRNTVRGAIVGGGAGLGAGVVLVVTKGADDAEAVSGGAPDDAFGDELQAWKLIVPAVAGAAVGAFVGYSLRTPRWAPAFVPARSGGDFALAWTVAVPG
jgi:hypothetical protein